MARGFSEELSRSCPKEVMAEHVHRSISIGATDAPAHVVWPFKSRTALVLCLGFLHLRNRATMLWSPKYWAVSVGDRSGSTECRYIEHRWDTAAS